MNLSKDSTNTGGSSSNNANNEISTTPSVRYHITKFTSVRDGSLARGSILFGIAMQINARNERTEKETAIILLYACSVTVLATVCMNPFRFLAIPSVRCAVLCLQWEKVLQDSTLFGKYHSISGTYQKRRVALGNVSSQTSERYFLNKLCRLQNNHSKIKECKELILFMHFISMPYRTQSRSVFILTAVLPGLWRRDLSTRDTNSMNTEKRWERHGWEIH